MGTDKAQIIYNGMTLLERAHSLLRALGASQIITLGRSSAPDGIADPVPFEGPARAIAAWLTTQAAPQNLLVLPIDMPALTEAPLRELLSRPDGGYFDDLYLPFYAPMVSPMLANQSHRMRELLAEFRLSALPIPEKWRLELSNVNTPADLNHLKTRH